MRAPSSPPRHNRRLRDYGKLERGKLAFNAVTSKDVAVTDLSATALSDALYYASDSVTGAVGTNAVKKAVRAEAKKRGLPIR